MEFLYFLAGIGVIVMIVAGVRFFSAQQEISSISKQVSEMQQDAGRRDLLRHAFEEQAKMIISDIQHDYMVEFTEEQWERFLKEDNPALAAFEALPKGMPPLEEFKEKLFDKGNHFLYGCGLDFETANDASLLLKKEIDTMDEMYLGFLMRRINQSATGEYAFMKNTINYDSTVSSLLYTIAEETENEELAACVMRHAEKKGWINSAT